MKNSQRNLPLWIIILILGLVVQYTNAQVPEWIWATGAGTGNNGNYLGEISHGITNDNNGNLYVTGSMRSPVVKIGKDTLKNAAKPSFYLKPDMFIAKYDEYGKALWAKSVGDTGSELGNSIVTDKNGSVYVTGSFDSPFISFGTITLKNSTPGSADIFVVKYNFNGNALWAKSFGGGGQDAGNAIGIDTDGNIIVAGYLSSSPLLFGADTVYTAGYKAVLLMKYDNNGNEKWARSVGGVSQYFGNFANSLAIDSMNNIYIAGAFADSVLNFQKDTILNRGHIDLFLAKYDDNGIVQWARSAGNKYYDEALRLAADRKGNIFMTGAFFSPSITFGAVTLTNTELDPDGTKFDDMFIVKYDTGGNALWGKTGIGQGYEVGNSIAVDYDGSAYITGLFWGANIAFGNTILKNSRTGYNETFVVKYDKNGNEDWAKSAGGSENDQGNSITVANNGDIFITGGCNSGIAFGKVVWASTGFYIAKLSNTPNSVLTEFSDSDRFDIFPNPTNGNIFVTGLDSDNWSITIYSLDGESIFQSQINISQPVIDLIGKPKGTYVFTLEKGNEILKTGKFIIE
ncbi:MAG: T9SS type A sorting domain-containing protein [Bacteroidota bacterium]